MVGFRNTVGSADLKDWVAPSGSRIAFGRGTTVFSTFKVIDRILNLKATWAS